MLNADDATSVLTYDPQELTKVKQHLLTSFTYLAQAVSIFSCGSRILWCKFSSGFREFNGKYSLYGSEFLFHHGSFRNQEQKYRLGTDLNQFHQISDFTTSEVRISQLQKVYLPVSCFFSKLSS